MKIWEATKEIPEPYKFIAVMWLSFLMAVFATLAFYVSFDPNELISCSRLPWDSNTAFYTVTFVLFWLLTASSSLLTTYFLKSGK